MRGRIDPSTLFLLVCSKSRTLDTLNQILLAEEVKNYKGSDYHKTASVSDSCIVEILSRVVRCKRGGDCDDLRHKDLLTCGIEELCVEVISPLPREREQEYCYHHRNGQGKNNRNDCSDYARTVDVSRLLKFIRNASEELSEHKDIKTVLKCKTCERENDQRPVCVGKNNTGRCEYLGLTKDIDSRKELLSEQLDSATREKLEYSEDIEISEVHKE